jgi:drug/metabolite transporter (DMT)-like permease
VRASGPLWTLFGGIVIFGEYLSAVQLAGLGLCLVSYYLLAVAGKREGIVALRSMPIAMMIIATLLSALTTVYDKYLVQQLAVPILDIQFYSAFHRFFIAAAILIVAVSLNWRGSLSFQWRWDVALVGVSWVVAELVYFLAYLEPDAMVTHLSVFRRASLIVGFMASVLIFKEQHIPLKSMMIALLVAGMGILILA